MYVWHVQMVAKQGSSEQQPLSLSAHPAFLQAGTELGTHCSVPPPVLAGISGSAARSLRRFGASGLPRQEREEARTTPLPSSLPHPQVQSPPLWALSAEGEQRVLSEKAQGWDRVGAAGNQPALPPPLPFGGSWGRLGSLPPGLSLPPTPMLPFTVTG